MKNPAKPGKPRNALNMVTWWLFCVRLQHETQHDTGVKRCVSAENNDTDTVS